MSVASAVLASATGFLGSDTTLLLSLNNYGVDLSNLADTFRSRIAPNERRQRKVPIISFYETKKTYFLGLSLGVVSVHSFVGSRLTLCRWFHGILP